MCPQCVFCRDNDTVLLREACPDTAMRTIRPNNHFREVWLYVYCKEIAFLNENCEVLNANLKQNIFFFNGNNWFFVSIHIKLNLLWMIKWFQTHYCFYSTAWYYMHQALVREPIMLPISDILQIQIWEQKCISNAIFKVAAYIHYIWKWHIFPKLAYL